MKRQCVTFVLALLLVLSVGSPALAIRDYGAIYDETESGKREIYQQFINAQHDMYHTPDMNRWLSYPAYVLDIEEIYGSVVLVIGMLNDKDADGVVSELAPMCSAIYVTQPDSPRALPCEDLAETVRRHGRVDGVFRTIGEAMEAALDGRGDDNVLVTGSFRMAEGVLRWMAERSSRFSTRSQRSTWAERILAATRRV